VGAAGGDSPDLVVGAQLHEGEVVAHLARREPTRVAVTDTQLAMRVVAPAIHSVADDGAAVGFTG